MNGEFLKNEIDTNKEQRFLINFIQASLNNRLEYHFLGHGYE